MEQSCNVLESLHVFRDFQTYLELEDIRRADNQIE